MKQKIVLGVTGGIAAYKAVELLRLLSRGGAEVQVAMTESAQRFVTPLTFAALSGRKVLTDLWDSGSEEIQHVEWAHRADAMVIAPATANAIARLATGMADDMVLSLALATGAPLFVAPAMETGMWLHPATRENVERLRTRGAIVIDPEDGALASGRSGVGRMAEPARIAEVVFGPRDFAGQKVLITAGPTYEPLDPVRVLTNRSTGAMGIALAEAAARRGADVTLILGPTPLSARVETVAVETAAEMYQACLDRIAAADVFIAAAAVSDFRPRDPSVEKLKRNLPGATTIELLENPDILKDMAARKKPGAMLVGFAAETEKVREHAAEKLIRKGCDLIVANRVGPGVGFGPKATEVTVLALDGRAHEFGPATKSAVAEFVLDQIATHRAQR